jgi:isocitrate/isopropylmalate dehydrogenase
LGASLRIAVVPGDGIGVEVIGEAVKVLAAVAKSSGKGIAPTSFDWGAERFLATGVSLPDGALAMLRDGFDAILLGAMGDPRVPDNRHAAEILLRLRFELDLYVNYRPIRLLHERLCPLKGARREDVDFVVFRENTEGPYVMMGGHFKKGTPDEVATQIDLNTRKGVERIVRHAFAFAKARGKKRVCMSDKSNVLVHAHELWQRVFRSVAAEFRRSRPAPLRRQPRAAAGARAEAVRRRRHVEHVRRHRDGPGRRAAGRARDGRVRQHPSRKAEPVRAGARLVASARRQERREPHGGDPGPPR